LLENFGVVTSSVRRLKDVDAKNNNFIGYRESREEKIRLNILVNK